MAKATVKAIAIDPTEILATEAEEVLVEVDMMVAEDLTEVARMAEVAMVSTAAGPAIIDPAAGPAMMTGVGVGVATWITDGWGW